MNSNIKCADMQQFSDLVLKQKNAVLAATLRIDDSVASRIRNGEIGLKVKQIDDLLANLGYELCPKGSFVVPADEWLTLKKMARRALDYDILMAESHISNGDNKR